MGDSQDQSLSKLSLWQPENSMGLCPAQPPLKLQMYSQRLWGPGQLCPCKRYGLKQGTQPL